MIHGSTTEIVNLFTAAPYVKIKVLTHGTRTEQLVIPIYIRKGIRIQSGTCPVYLLLIIKHFTRITSRDCLIEHFHISDTIYKLRNLSRSCKRIFKTEIDHGFFQILTRFSRNNHYPIRSTRTIKRSCRSIL